MNSVFLTEKMTSITIRQSIIVYKHENVDAYSSENTPTVSNFLTDGISVMCNMLLVRQEKNNFVERPSLLIEFSYCSRQCFTYKKLYTEETISFSYMISTIYNEAQKQVSMCLK